MRLSRYAALLVLLIAAVARADIFDEKVPGAIGSPTAPSDTMIEGVRVRSSTVVSKLDAQTLKAHFAEVFDKSGLYVAEEVKDIELPNALQVTAVDTDRMVSYTVLLQKGAKKTTTVILTATYLAHAVKTPADAFAPMIPGATSVEVADVETANTMSYSTTATPAEVKAFYREKFAAMGFQETSELLFDRNNEQISLAVAPGLSTRSVLLIREVTGFAAPPAAPMAPANPSDRKQPDAGRK